MFELGLGDGIMLLLTPWLVVAVVLVPVLVAVVLPVGQVLVVRLVVGSICNVVGSACTTSTAGNNNPGGWVWRGHKPHR